MSDYGRWHWPWEADLLDVDDRLGRLETKVTRHAKELASMATVQEHLDAAVAQINEAVDGIRADVEALKAANPNVDFTALDASVARLAALDAENPESPPSGV